MNKLFLPITLLLSMQTAAYAAGVVTSDVPVQVTVEQALQYKISHKRPTIEIQSTLTVAKNKNVTVSAHYPEQLNFRDATEVTVVTNSLKGYAFEITFLPNRFASSVVVEIQGHESITLLTVGEKKNIAIPYNSKPSHTKKIHYSFKVLKSVSEGSYPLPINIVVFQR